MITLAIATAPKRDSKTWKNEVVTWEEFKRWCASPGNQKEAGNYVFGRLNGTRRSKRTIEARSALTLDVDFPQAGFLTDVMMLPFNLVWHTTYSSLPEQPRYRLIVPLDREVNPHEYEACVIAVMDMLGTEQFDLGSTQAERYMFKPAAQKPDFYSWGEVEGSIATADDLIVKADAVITDYTPPTPSRKKRDPFQIEGVIGAFNRVYEDLDELIGDFDLPYEKDGEKWRLKGSLGVAGMGPVPERPGLWYSFHSTDPAFMQTCSAFDLVRIHLFGEMDEDAKPQTPVNKLPSHARMFEEVMNGDPDISAKVVTESFAADFGGPDTAAPPASTPAPQTTPSGPTTAPSRADWRAGLALSQAGAVRDTLDNWDLIIKNDPIFVSLAHNEVTYATEPQADLPWRPVTRTNAVWQPAIDGPQLALHLERTVRLKVPQYRIDAMVHRAAFARRIDPVADYLKSLVWDGRPRVETCLPGVSVNDFTRLAARKSLVAAAARALEPGIKWDHSLILFGSEGLGKSLWIERMSKGWTAELGDLKAKDTLQIVARTWIAVADEGHSLKKADSGTMKAFMTRQNDVYRAPYEALPTEHPRRCVVWGSTNEETFLRREAGNRRFLIVECGPYDIDALTPGYVDQVWAEAVHLYRAGERLWLDGDESEEATQAREIFTEENPMVGQIQAYLDMPVPTDWYKMSSAARYTHRQNYLEFGADEGLMQQDRVCALQIWYELLNGNRKPQQVELREINEAIRLLPEWYSVAKVRRFDSSYGVQRGFNRFQDEELI
jgi:putative DNA primase/helicase